MIPYKYLTIPPYGPIYTLRTPGMERPQTKAKKRSGLGTPFLTFFYF